MICLYVEKDIWLTAARLKSFDLEVTFMFIRLDEARDIAIKDVVAILNAESFNCAECNMEFLRRAVVNGDIKKLSDGETKSVIIANVNGKQTIYFSPISTITLYKRAYIIDEMNIL